MRLAERLLVLPLIMLILLPGVAAGQLKNRLALARPADAPSPMPVLSRGCSLPGSQIGRAHV